MHLFNDLHYFLAVQLGLSRDVLLMAAGLAPMLITMLLFRRGLGSLWPWLVVVFIVLLREGWGLKADLDHDGAWHWRGAFHDSLMTLFWPTCIWLSLHLRPPRGN